MIFSYLQKKKFFPTLNQNFLNPIHAAGLEISPSIKWIKLLPVCILVDRNNVIWDKVFNNGPSKICGRQHLKI